MTRNIDFLQEIFAIDMLKTLKILFGALSQACYKIVETSKIGTAATLSIPKDGAGSQ